MASTKLKKEAQQLSSPMAKLLADEKNAVQLPQVGDLIKGKVISASKKQVLVDIAGLTSGLVRGKELYNESPLFADLKVGDEVEATVLEMENEQGLLELSFRYAGHQKAWATLQTNKDTGMILPAKVLDANKGGLLVSVNHIPGFLPVSQLNPEHYPRIQGGDKNKILERLKSYVNQTFEVKVIDVNDEQEKLIVSEKAAWEESQSDVLGKYGVGDVIEGVITAITDFGIFIKFGENLEGLAHISELAWQRIDNPRNLFKVGQEIKASIINIEGSKIFLSLKKLLTDPWAGIEEKYKLGQEVTGKVLKVNPFGLFVELDDEIHGLAHISELSDKPITDINEFAKPGQEMKFIIVSIEPKEHRLGLSAKAVVGKPKKNAAKDSEESPAAVEPEPPADDKAETAD